MGLFNECFRSCTALDPEKRSNVSVLRCLRYLAQTVPTVLKEGEQDAYDREVHSFVNEDTSKLPPSTLPIDKWLAQVVEIGFSNLLKWLEPFSPASMDQPLSLLSVKRGIL